MGNITAHSSHLSNLQMEGTGSVQWDAKFRKNQWAMADWHRET